MILALIKYLEQADSGLFIHAPEGTCQLLAEALGEAGKTLAGLTETEDSARAIETDRAALESMTRLQASPFFYASLIDARTL